MAPNGGWIAAAVTALIATALALAAVPADAEDGIPFDAEFIDMSGDIYLTIELKQEFEFSLEVTAVADGDVIEGDIPPMTAFVAFRADAPAASVYAVTVKLGGVSGSGAADPSLADSNCLVRFMDWDGTVLRTCVVHGGDTPECAEPSREGYTFSGWDPELGPVTGDTVYAAQYDDIRNTYSVSVGAVKKSTAVRATVQVLEGDAVEDGEITLEYTYTEEKMSYGKIRVITHTASMDAVNIQGGAAYASVKLDMGALDHYSQIKTAWAEYTPIGGEPTKSSAIIYQPLTLNAGANTGEDTI